MHKQVALCRNKHIASRKYKQIALWAYKRKASNLRATWAAFSYRKRAEAVGSIWVIWLPELTDLGRRRSGSRLTNRVPTAELCDVFEPMSFAELRQKSSAKSPVKSRVGQRFLGQWTWVCYGCDKGFQRFLRVLWVAIRAS